MIARTSYQPPWLKPGDRVDIVAPAGPMLADRLARGVEVLSAAGFRVNVRPSATHVHPTRPYLAASDDIRAADVIDALCDPACKAVMAARGGYGTMRILGALDEAIADQSVALYPKWIVGFSDITALHTWAFTRLGWHSLHAAMPFNLADDTPDAAITRTWTLAALEGVHACSPRLIRARVSDAGPIVGRLIGGNLSLVGALYRTAYLPTLKRAILFVEDVGERLYRLDRLVTQLRLSGADQEVAAVVLGSFTNMSEPPDIAAAEVAKLFRTWGVPVYHGLDAGHRHPNRPLVHGAIYKIANETLTLQPEISHG